MANKDHAAGASASLNKTISEIMKFLGDDDERRRGKLRPKLRKKVGDLAERWFRKGFNRGHIESHKYFKARDVVPITLTFECSRNLAPDAKRDLVLKSKIRAKPKKSKAAARKTRP